MSKATTKDKPSEQERYATLVADEELSAGEALMAITREYAQQRPEVVALWTFGIGFVLGWKLKPW